MEIPNVVSTTLPGVHQVTLIVRLLGAVLNPLPNSRMSGLKVIPILLAAPPVVPVGAVTELMTFAK